MKQQAASLALTLARLRRRSGALGPSLADTTADLARTGTLAVFPVLAILGMVPSPGLPLGAFCGSLIAWLAINALLNRPLRPLPPRLGTVRIPPTVLKAALRLLIGPLRRLEKLSRPRLAALTLPWAAWLSIIVQGVVMALPIPFGNVLPGITVIVLAVALIRHDGLGAALGHALGLISLGILIGLGWGVAALV